MNLWQPAQVMAEVLKQRVDRRLIAGKGDILSFVLHNLACNWFVSRGVWMVTQLGGLIWTTHQRVDRGVVRSRVSTPDSVSDSSLEDLAGVAWSDLVSTVVSWSSNGETGDTDLYVILMQAWRRQDAPPPASGNVANNREPVSCGPQFVTIPVKDLSDDSPSLRSMLETADSQVDDITCPAAGELALSEDDELSSHLVLSEV